MSKIEQGPGSLERPIIVPDVFRNLSPELQQKAREIYLRKMREAIEAISYPKAKNKRETTGGIIALRHLKEVFFREAVVEAQAQLEAEKGKDKGNYDELTGLPGEKPFFRNFGKAIEELEAPEFTERHCLVMISFDIDFFKTINDNPALGHGVADEILKAVAEAIKSQARAEDLFCRASSAGDEFMIALRQVPLISAEAAVRRIHLVLSQITAENIVDPELRERARQGGFKHVSVSMGALVMKKNSQIGVVGARTESDHAGNVTKGKGKSGYTLVIPGTEQPLVMVRRLEDSGSYKSIYENDGYPLESREDREYHVLRSNQRILEEIDLAVRQGKLDPAQADKARRRLIEVGGILHQARESLSAETE